MVLKQLLESIRGMRRTQFTLRACHIRLISLSIGLMNALGVCQFVHANDDFTVVASIKPIHSIVSAIMQGVGEPHLIMKGTASPHTFNLRPSDARALDRSDVVFQVGQAMEASLADIMWTLAERAEIVSLSHATKLVKLSHRAGGVFDTHEHSHGESSSHAAETVPSSSPQDPEYDSAQTYGVDSGDLLKDSVDESFDMHIWLDPQNGRVIAEVIASVLAKNDPENVDIYASNLAEFIADSLVLEEELKRDLEGLNDRPFIAFHDAYRYFEEHFNLYAVASAVVVPGRSAGARRIQELRRRISELNVVCVFSEPQFDEQLILTIVEDTEAKIGVLDPLGATLEDGKHLYPALLRNMRDSFRDCLNPVT